MTVTINDVAKEAGASITTVSRVINNNYPVKKETRERIEKAIEKLNYKPNTMARSLITKRTSVIGVIVPGVTNLFFPTIVEAVEEYTKSKGYTITLCNTGGDYKEERALVEGLMSRQVDGLIIIDPAIENLEQHFYEELCRKKPVVVVNGSPKEYKCNFVCYDEEEGTREAFRYLLELGHKKIAFVRGYKSVSYDTKEKIYKEVLEMHGMAYERILNVGQGNSIEVVEKAQVKLEELLNKTGKPTAIFACNDLMAVGVIHACNKVGLSVGKDISVVGFDNTILASITHPKLTSVDQNMKDIGHRAAIELLDIIENGIRGRKKVILDTTLIKRESCGVSTE